MDIEIVEVRIPKAIDSIEFNQGIKGDRGVSITDFTLDDEGNAVTTFDNGETKTSKLTSIASASASAKKAATSEVNAKDYANKALTSEANAKTSENNAATYADNAKDSEEAAKFSEITAKNSEKSAKSSEEISSAKAEEAADSATSASNSATKAFESQLNSAKSAESAEDSYNKTASIQNNFQVVLDTAKASETAAKVSETNAKTSETSSADSANKAHTSEINAKASETNAAASASTATTQASNASKSATAAKASETNAKSSETASSISATNAKTSESNAASSASSASDSEAGAATQASNAAKSATSASSYASSAKTSEANAKLSETHSASSASSASTSASNAKTSETNAKTSETNAGASATTAKNWAVSETSPDGATDTDSGTGKTQSSRTWALESKANAQSASASASTATTQASSATASAKSASTSATSASDSATSAASSATSASNSASVAATSATNASNSESQASEYKTSASGSATAAASSASSASTSATNAKAAMNTANTAASSASTSATSASTSASNASKSEIAAKTAQTAAEKARDDANSAVSKLTGVMKYAGQVDNYSDLADVTKNKGDVWNIVNADNAHGVKAGDNVVWNGTDWDNLSGYVDLSSFAQKDDYQKVITSATANGATITFNHKDGTTSTTTVNNVASATAAANDSKGQKIDTTYEKVADASNVHTSLQNSINSLSTGKQDKLTFDTAPIADSSNPVTSGGVKTYVDNIKNTLNTAISKKADSTDIVQSDWNVADTTSKAFIKNKPDVVTYKEGQYKETTEWESNCVQSMAAGFPEDHPDAYEYGVQVTLGVIGRGGSTRLYFPHHGGMYLKNFWDDSSVYGWVNMLDDNNFSQYALPKDGTAVKATQDASGNVITDTYATKTEVAEKQDKLTFDSIPNISSTNPVTSNGIQTALDKKLNKSSLDDSFCVEWNEDNNLVVYDKSTPSEKVAIAPYMIGFSNDAYEVRIGADGNVQGIALMDNSTGEAHSLSLGGKLQYGLYGGEMEDIATENYVQTSLDSYAKKTDLSSYQTKLTFDSTPMANSSNPVTSGGVKTALDKKADTSSLKTVATSGSYNDLTNRPTIPTVPTKVSAFTNDAGYLTAHQSLSNYYTKTQVDTAITNAISAITDGDSKSY